MVGSLALFEDMLEAESHTYMVAVDRTEDMRHSADSIPVPVVDHTSGKGHTQPVVRSLVVDLDAQRAVDQVENRWLQD